jgi:hypothetical protein
MHYKKRESRIIIKKESMDAKRGIIKDKKEHTI